jgi:hypothetical protein
MPSVGCSRTRRAVGFGIAAAVGLILAATPTPARGATTGPVYSGTGWKIWTSAGIHSLDRDPYTITFATSASRTRLTPYAKAIASQLTAVTGTRFTVTTTIEAPPTGGCVKEHHLILGVKYRPTGAKGVSHAYPCYTNRPGQPDNHTAWGGWVWMDSEYWSSSHWFSTNSTTNTAMTKNAVTHEFGHLVGLAHPNYDRDKDGTVEPFECVKNSAGRRPVMCAPSGGYMGATTGGKFTTEYDVPGLKQLVKNYGLG